VAVVKAAAVSSLETLGRVSAERAASEVARATAQTLEKPLTAGLSESLQAARSVVGELHKAARWASWRGLLAFLGACVALWLGSMALGWWELSLAREASLPLEKGRGALVSELERLEVEKRELEKQVWKLEKQGGWLSLEVCPNDPEERLCVRVDRRQAFGKGKDLFVPLPSSDF
jgi:hypothetical protein